MNEITKQYLAIKGEIKWHWHSWAVNVAVPLSCFAVAYLWMWV